MALAFLYSPTPPRSITASANPLITEDGKTQVEFLPRNTKYMMQVTHPPGAPGSSIHDPPYHWHVHQTEHFHVKSGSARATLRGNHFDVPEGESFSIPKQAYHTFHNASLTEPLVIQIGLDPAQRERDERFFRNLYSYLDECYKIKQKPSVCQIMLFLWHFDCMPALPGPELVMRPVAKWMAWSLGVMLGKGMWGMRETYPEYYKEGGRVE